MTASIQKQVVIQRPRGQRITSYSEHNFGNFGILLLCIGAEVVFDVSSDGENFETYIISSPSETPCPFGRNGTTGVSIDIVLREVKRKICALKVWNHIIRFCDIFHHGSHSNRVDFKAGGIAAPVWAAILIAIRG